MLDFLIHRVQNIMIYLLKKRHIIMLPIKIILKNESIIHG
nr:MAG TPA: hypothetical protein [Caudoviricetes sp.]